MAQEETAPRPEEALVDLLRRSQRQLRALFRRFGIGPTDAEDLLQESVLIVLRSWGRIANPSGYLLNTVRRQILLLFRKRRVENRVELDEMLEAGISGEYPQRSIEARKDAQTLLRSLPKHARRVVEMRYGGELSSREIALILNCSDESVRKTASRSLRRLRQVAEDLRHRS